MSNLFMEKEFQDAGFITERINEAILIVHDFISKEELDILLDIIKITPEDDWSKTYRANLARFCLEKFGRDDVENLVAEGKYEITEGWDDKNLDISHNPIASIMQTRFNKILNSADETLELAGLSTFQRMQEGVRLQSHTDQHTDPSIKYATILYINDNYKDGTIFFKNKNLDLRPKPGQLLVFPGNEEYEHGVNVVGKGPIRYVIVGFLKIRNFYNNNKY